MITTPAQEQAVTARGNVLLVAGAGAGKTSTLVNRCLHCLLEEKPRVGLDRLLLVTFTEAAAWDMRRKIREALEARLEAAAPQDQRWLNEQLALFETAHIGTLHSFCYQLVREHFYELELDPQLSVLPEEEGRLMAGEVLNRILEGHYAGVDAESRAVQELIQSQGRGWDRPIRLLVLKLHDYSQTLRNPGAWFDAQLAMFNSPQPVQWALWLAEGVKDWRDRWLPVLRGAVGNPKAVEFADCLAKLPVQPARSDCAAVFDAVQRADSDWPKGKRTAWRNPLLPFLDEGRFLGSLARADAGDPLAEDWNWVRSQMAVLLRLAQEFTAAFADAKRERGALDFHDLEQCALRVLAIPDVANHWREKFRFVFVDEYQDINDAQDAILKALSGEGADANRFLVGDVKQSIYRFRLADPRIFQEYVATWQGHGGAVIPLTDNFRSREAILLFVNSLFGTLMRREIGGVPYDEDARLRFGDAENRRVLSLAHDPAPRVELHLRLKGGADDFDAINEDAAPGPLANLEEADKEARLVGLRLRELMDARHEVWDHQAGAMRPVRWKDMAILLRSPSRKAESYAKEFARLGLPLLVARGGFYESLEISDLLSLLQVLDNPLQDLPLLAVLRSPLVGMSVDELAAIRLLQPRGNYWAALQLAHEDPAARPGWSKASWERLDRFLQNFAAWRRLARQAPLSHCLETILGATHYAEWLLAQPRGDQRHTNIQRLLALARRFDRFQRQGLLRFLRFIEAQQEAETEPEPGAPPAEDAVSLMSIHQSKGLEFPVVVVADLGKPFNLSDLRAEIILDEQFGLCPQVKPPHTGQRYPSLPYWLARQRQKRQLLAEEMRLLYVAMTRARDTLILTGTLEDRDFEKRWCTPQEVTTAGLLAARNCLDWLAAWSRGSRARLLTQPEGANEWLRWTVHRDDRNLADTPPVAVPGTPAAGTPHAPDEHLLQRLRERIEWTYSHQPATLAPAKATVSELRRELAEGDDGEAAPLFEAAARRRRTRAPVSAARSGERLTATQIGSAHHTFLEFVSLDRVAGVAALKQEASRLEREQVLTPEEAASLDFKALAAFWGSDLGQGIRAESRNVLRELAFTARFAPEELAASQADAAAELAGEFVVVQGVADLVVLLPGEIWIVDFKTDDITAREVEARTREYTPQLNLYARALGRIYRRPVTRMFLHFLAPGRSVPVAPPGGSEQRTLGIGLG
jgi:ATP-dependent helicase/nuclease subunit A